MLSTGCAGPPPTNQDPTNQEKQLNQWVANYRAFDAPVMLLFFLDKLMQMGSYIDYGMFLQSIMLAAV